MTTDPVDILNSVTVEGWKLVTGKFIHSEMRNGVVGCYLFKRSQKRRLAMNNPWQDPQRHQLSSRSVPPQGWPVGACQRCGASRASAASGPQEPGS